MSGAHVKEMCAVEEEKISMSSKRTHSKSIAARGRRASGRTCAGQFSERGGVGAAVVCAGSLPTYLPGGAVMQENAKSTQNLWISDRQGNLS